jgi:hypothetical protein
MTDNLPPATPPATPEPAPPAPDVRKLPKGDYEAAKNTLLGRSRRWGS